MTQLLSCWSGLGGFCLDCSTNPGTGLSVAADPGVQFSGGPQPALCGAWHQPSTGRLEVRFMPGSVPMFHNSVMMSSCPGTPGHNCVSDHCSQTRLHQWRTAGLCDPPRPPCQPPSALQHGPVCPLPSSLPAAASPASSAALCGPHPPPPPPGPCVGVNCRLC